MPAERDEQVDTFGDDPGFDLDLDDENDGLELLDDESDDLDIDDGEDDGGADEEQPRRREAKKRRDPKDEDDGLEIEFAQDDEGDDLDEEGDEEDDDLGSFDEEAIRAQAREEARGEYAPLLAHMAETSLGTSRAMVAAKLEAAEARLEAVQDQIEAAKEAGETKQEVKLQTELAKLAPQVDQLKAAQARLKGATPDDVLRDLQAEVPRGNGQDGDGGSAGIKPANDLAAKYQRSNRWIGTKGHEEATQYLQMASSRLATDGVAIDDPEHYRRLDRIMHKRFPEVFEGAGRKRPKGKLPSGGSPRPRAAAGSKDRQEMRRLSQGKIRLTKQDREIMRTFDLDPGNSEHVKAFAAERRETLKQEARERRR